MPHGPIGIGHTILYNWTLRVMTLFKGLCTSQKLMISHTKLNYVLLFFIYTRPSLGAIDQTFRHQDGHGSPYGMLPPIPLNNMACIHLFKHSTTLSVLFGVSAEIHTCGIINQCYPSCM